MWNDLRDNGVQDDPATGVWAKGFDTGSYIDITVNIDTDDMSFNWSATGLVSGVSTTLSGTKKYIPTTGNLIDPGLFTIWNQNQSPYGSAYIDYFKVTADNAFTADSTADDKINLDDLANMAANWGAEVLFP